MFQFFDFFARTLNYEPGRPKDDVEARREASIGTRRVLARRERQQAAEGGKPGGIVG